METIYMSMSEEQTRRYYSKDEGEMAKVMTELITTAHQIANREKKEVHIYTCAIAVTGVRPTPDVPMNPPKQPDTTA